MLQSTYMKSGSTALLYTNACTKGTFISDLYTRDFINR